MNDKELKELEALLRKLLAAKGHVTDYERKAAVVTLEAVTSLQHYPEA